MSTIKKILPEIIIGALIGFFILHPISMFLAKGTEGIKIFFSQNLRNMLLSPMSLYFSILGVSLGLISGISRLKLINKNLLLQKHKNEILAKNAILEQQKEEILTQAEDLKKAKNKIKKQNDKISASINYAKSIQQAILPPISKMQQELSDFFLIYKPQNIISGDFYWFDKIDQKLFIAAVDCTGHGVPGALISMIGHTLLNEIIKEQKIQKPNEIIEALDILLRNILNQEKTGNNDGMDMSICIIDKKLKILEFAGARNPLVFIKNKQVQVIKGDRRSVGGYIRRQQSAFTRHEINFDADTCFYMFSDGFQDQYDEQNKNRFSLRNMLSLFLQYHNLTMEQQKNEIENNFIKWKGSNRQIDDLLIIGFKC